MSLKNPVLGQYVPGNSYLHRMDPRAKLIFVFIYMFLVFLANNGWTYSLLSVMTLSALLLSRVPVRLIAKGLKPILILILFTSLLHLFFTRGGEVLLQWGPLIVYENGVIQAGWISLRFLLLVLTGTLLTLTTSPMDLTDGMERLLSPFVRFGVPAHDLALMMSIALRFIPTLWDEAEKIMKAQQARGADFESGGLIRRAKSYIPVLIPLFVSAFRRADDLALAMEARAYRGGEGRSRLRKLEFTHVDVFALILLVVLLPALLYFRS